MKTNMTKSPMSKSEGGLARKVLSIGGRTTSWTASKIAIPAAVFSTVHSGSYLERGLGGVKTTYDVITGPIFTYLNDTGIQEAVNGATLKVMSSMGDLADNVVDDPTKMFYTALGVFGSLKAPEVAKHMVDWNAKRRDKKELARYRGEVYRPSR